MRYLTSMSREDILAVAAGTVVRVQQFCALGHCPVNYAKRLLDR